MPKLLTAVLTTIRNKDAQFLIGKTWGKEAVKDGNGLVFLTDLGSDSGVQWCLTTDTRYASNELKVVAGLNTIVQKMYNFDWVLLCDDDTVINYNLIREALPTLDVDRVHGTILHGKWQQDRTLDYPSGGGGTLFPMSLLFNLPKFKHHNTGYADVSCGLWMRDNDVIMQYAPFKMFHTTWYGLDMFNPDHHAKIREQASFHYIKQPNEIMKLHTIFHGESEGDNHENRR